MYIERTTWDFQFFITDVCSYYLSPLICSDWLQSSKLDFLSGIYLSQFSLKFKCAIIAIIYLNSLLFPLTKKIWMELEIKQPDDEWGASGEWQEEQWALWRRKNTLVKHLYGMILGTLFLTLTDMLSGNYHFPLFTNKGPGDQEDEVTCPRSVNKSRAMACKARSGCLQGLQYA